MNIKLIIFTYALTGWISIANAYETGDKIFNSYQTKVVGNIAACAYSVNTPSHYAVDIYSVSIKPYVYPKNITEIWTPPVSIIDKKLWTITSDQLPITEDICSLNGFDICIKNFYSCYGSCFSNSDPDILAIDNKNKKVYLNYASQMVGTGGGPSFLLVADINKREIKLLGIISVQVKGSLSPSGRYFVVHCNSVISIYDTEKKSWFDVNESENDYSNKDRYIIHDLDVIKWLGDTRFVYIDNAKYFTRPVDDMPFISAKQITYDISTKTKSNEKVITEKEYEEIMKVAQNK